MTPIEQLQNHLKEKGMDAYILFTNDDHGSEYVVDHYKARAYFSGFTGSAGVMVVTQTESYLWTDGRYFLQAEEQLKKTGTKLMKMGEAGYPTIPEFLCDLKQDGVVGFDFKIATVSFVKNLLGKASALKLIDDSAVIDEIWRERPDMVPSNAYVLPLTITGESAESKIKTLREDVKKAGAQYALIASLDDIAWLYNLRGKDIMYNPVNYAFTLIGQETAVLYMDINIGVKNDSLMEYLHEVGVELRPYGQIYEDIRSIDERVLLDAGKTNYALYNAVKDKKEVLVFPTTARKSIKNKVEIRSCKRAHIEDAVAMIKFMHYLKKNVGKVPMSEISLSDKLEKFRKEGKDFLDLSFDTISGYNEHGAIVHYSATPESDVPVYKDGFLLVDSGAQYTCGTTDITRTFALGNITKRMKKHFTLVLKAHIALATAIFPEGTSGMAVDMLAREPLYREKLDFRHGTGHGVGHVLNVHEGPQRISMRGTAADALYPLHAGMITSDEPGLYLAGEYGIRHENLTLCVEKGHSEYGTFLGFEPLTFVPFDRDGIEASLLTDEELEWLNDYHAEIYKKVSPYLTEELAKYLKKITLPIVKE